MGAINPSRYLARSGVVARNVLQRMLAVACGAGENATGFGFHVTRYIPDAFASQLIGGFVCNALQPSNSSVEGVD